MMKDVFFPSNKGLELAGVLHTPASPASVGVLILHGLRASKDQLWMKELGEKLSHEGFVALRFDFLGNGESEGKFDQSTYDQAVKDVEAAISFLKKSHDVESVFALGHSYGGGVALVSGLQLPLSGVIGLAPVTNPAGISNRIVKRLGKDVFVGTAEGPISVPQSFVQSALAIDGEKLMKGFSLPLLLIHGSADRMLDYHFSQEFVEKCPSADKKFVRLEGANHLFSEHWHEVTPLVLEWLHAREDVRVEKRDEKFCPKCGTTQGDFIGLFCSNCYLKDHPDLASIPPKLEIEVCSRCQKIRLFGKWSPQSEELLVDWVKQKVKASKLSFPHSRVEIIPNTDGTSLVRVFVQGELERQLVSFELASLLAPKKTMCNDDMLVSSNYFEGIIQVRFAEKTPEKVRDAMKWLEVWLKPMQRDDSKAVITIYSSQKMGFDARVVSGKAAKTVAIRLAKEMKGTFSASGKLIGLDDKGKHKQRMTYLIRLP